MKREIEENRNVDESKIGRETEQQNDERRKRSKEREREGRT